MRRARLLIDATEGMLSGKRGRGRNSFQMIGKTKENGWYVDANRLAEYRQK